MYEEKSILDKQQKKRKKRYSARTEGDKGRKQERETDLPRIQKEDSIFWA